MSNRRYILMSSSAGLVIRIAGAGLALASQIFIARVVGREHFGIYLYAMSSIALLAIVARLGIDSSLPRFLPVMLSQGKLAEYRGTLRLGFALPLALAAVLGAGALLYLLVLVPGDLSAKQGTLLLMLLALPAFTLSFIRRAAMISLKRVVWAELPDMVIRPALMLAGTAALYFALRSVTSQHIALLFAGASTTALAVGSLMLYRAQPPETQGAAAAYPVKEVMRISMPLLLMTGFSTAVAEFTVVCLGWYKPAEEVAVYGAAVRLSLLVAFALQAANTVLNPLIAQLYHSGKYAELQAALRDAAKWMFLLTSAALVGMVLLGKLGLSLFGDGFEAGYRVLLILLAGQAINALSGSVGSIMKMCNKQNQACAILVFSAVTNVVLCFILIPRYGAEGAAISVAVGQTLWNVLMLGYTTTILKLNPTLLPLPIKPVPDLLDETKQDAPTDTPTDPEP
ncbi:polysaccharide biosynthesis C-terminal domain-containing protein [Phycisphaeraceae bacterium D3-23]